MTDYHNEPDLNQQTERVYYKGEVRLATPEQAKQIKIEQIRKRIRLLEKKLFELTAKDKTVLW